MLSVKPFNSKKTHEEKYIENLCNKIKCWDFITFLNKSTVFFMERLSQ